MTTHIDAHTEAHTDAHTETAADLVPAAVDDPINAAILAISEDRISGFLRDPLGEVAARSGVDLETVVERIRAMLRSGAIRRVRQTLIANKLAPGALVAWQVPEPRLHEAFEFMFREDPFSGHVVIRSADPATPGSAYRLWTTLKVPVGYSLERHCEVLAERVGAERFRLMPAHKLFTLGVGHLRRRGLEPGSRTDAAAAVIDAEVEALSEREWRVLSALKREFAADELVPDLWRARAAEAGLDHEAFCATAEALDGRGVVGRFSTFLEHVKPVAGSEPVTRYNALFHWAVPNGRELDAGREVGRHHVMTHAYWREGGPEFRDVNVMGVAHGTDKQLLLDHKTAIDVHLAEAGITVGYTNVFWGGRSEIKPSEIDPAAYAAWCTRHGVSAEPMQ
ncbi:MAG: Lrp/AsnC family transcriptional regulator [Chloroflexi bacterium]|nr:Lrp/AsnC family transcriptional regulator [Chloroflexota bacterium]